MTFHQKVKVAGHAGKSDADVLSEYKRWTPTYDQDILKANYDGPRLVANSLAEEISESSRDTLKILDVGAGTGLVAKELRNQGFKNIDALDPSSEMLEKARESNLYQNYIISYITGDPLDIPAGTYDVIIGSAMFGHCHVPTRALHEMIRLVKPGGYIVMCTRLEITTIYDEYTDLEPTMDALEAEGKWRRVCRDTSHQFYIDKTAIVWKYKVL